MSLAVCGFFPVLMACCGSVEVRGRCWVSGWSGAKEVVCVGFLSPARSLLQLFCSALSPHRSCAPCRVSGPCTHSSAGKVLRSSVLCVFLKPSFLRKLPLLWEQPFPLVCSARHIHVSTDFAPPYSVACGPCVCPSPKMWLLFVFFLINLLKLFFKLEYSWFNVVLVSAVREGNGNPLQYSCLENSMDRGPWGAPVYGVAWSRTPLSDWTHTHSGFRGTAKQMLPKHIRPSFFRFFLHMGNYWVLSRLPWAIQ